MRILVRLMRDGSGNAAAEYGLLMAIVGTGIAFAALALGGAVGVSIE